MSRQTLRTELDHCIRMADSLNYRLVFKLSDDNITEIRTWPEFEPCTNPSSPRVGYYRGVEIYHEF